MEIHVGPSQDAQVVSIKGSLDTSTSTEAQNTLTGLIDGGATMIVADFAGVDYISSAGLRALLVAAKRLKAAGGEMRLCNLNPFVQEVFEISGFGVMFRVFDSREAALAPS